MQNKNNRKGKLDKPITDADLDAIFTRKNGVIPTIDTSSFLMPAYEEFMVTKILPHLNGSKIYIELVVLKELKKHAEGDDFRKAQDARRAMIFIQNHPEIFVIVGSPNDTGIADSYFLALVGKRIGKYHIVVITEDKSLTRSLEQMYINMGCVYNKRSLTIIHFSENRLRTLYDNTVAKKPFKNNGFKLNLTNPVVYTEDGMALRLTSTIGSGAQSRVFNIENDPGLVAKLLHPSIYKNDTAYQNFFDRVETLRSMPLKHPNIIFPEEIIYDANGTAVGYIMRKADGCTLHRLINSGTLTFIDAVTMVSEIADALVYLGNHGVTIPDLRLDNILTKNLNVCIIDSDGFSITGKASEKIVNPLYDPPQAFPTDAMAAMSFRFAVLSFQLFSGKHPFLNSGLTIRESIDKKCFLLTAYKQDILKCLSKELADAYLDTFRCKKSISLAKWKIMFEQYLHDIAD